LGSAGQPKCDRGRPLNLSRVVEMTTQIWRGLEHRDLKLRDIFVMDDHTAKIIEFVWLQKGSGKLEVGKKAEGQEKSVTFYRAFKATLCE
jgi:hypothetical protein